MYLITIIIIKKLNDYNEITEDYKQELEELSNEEKLTDKIKKENEIESSKK